MLQFAEKFALSGKTPVSYTHLDVYKRQLRAAAHRQANPVRRGLLHLFAHAVALVADAEGKAFRYALPVSYTHLQGGGGRGRRQVIMTLMPWAAHVLTWPVQRDATPRGGADPGKPAPVRIGEMCIRDRYEIPELRHTSAIHDID